MEQPDDGAMIAPPLRAIGTIIIDHLIKRLKSFIYIARMIVKAEIFQARAIRATIYRLPIPLSKYNLYFYKQQQNNFFLSLLSISMIIFVIIIIFILFNLFINYELFIYYLLVLLFIKSW